MLTCAASSTQATWKPPHKPCLEQLMTRWLTTTILHNSVLSLLIAQVSYHVFPRGPHRNAKDWHELAVTNLCYCHWYMQTFVLCKQRVIRDEKEQAFCRVDLAHIAAAWLGVCRRTWRCFCFTANTSVETSPPLHASHQLGQISCIV